MADRTQELLDKLKRNVEALHQTREFSDAYEAASHFDHVINDLGFAGSRMIGSYPGPYYVLACDKPAR